MFLGVFVVVGRGRKGALDELLRSSGELVGMLGGSAVPQMPPARDSCWLWCFVFCGVGLASVEAFVQGGAHLRPLRALWAPCLCAS